MNFGCAYNPRPAPGRCIKDPGYSKIDQQCEVTETGCRLNTVTQVPSTQPTKQVPLTKVTSKISGPISANYTSFDKKIYNFYGDMHYGMKDTCQPCKDIDLNTLGDTNPPGSESCWDISRVLAENFTKASQEGYWIDFYIEIPFLPRTKTTPSGRILDGKID